MTQESKRTILVNYVILQSGVPARMHFTRHDNITHEVMDARLGRFKPLNTLQFVVDELDGQPVYATYSISSDKHKRDFIPWLPGEQYRGYDFIITRSGSGDRTEYQVQAVKRPG